MQHPGNSTASATASVAWKWIIPLALLKFALPFLLINEQFSLQRDEFLYYAQGQHPAWGYLENPPLLSWLGTISSWMGGASWTLTLWPSLFGAATLVITALLTAAFGGRTWAQVIAASAFLIAAFVRMNALFQPNCIDLFIWPTCIYLLVRYQQTRKISFWYAFAGTVVVGFYGKYTILFPVAGIALSWLLTANWSYFTSRHTYIAVAGVLLLISPNLYWQYSHNWPIVHHMEELQDTQLKYLSKADFLKDQVLNLLGYFPVWMAGLIWLLTSKTWRWIGYTYLLVIVLLLLGRGKSYYALSIYPVLLAAGGAAWEMLATKRRSLRYVLPALILIGSAPVLPILLPFAPASALAKIYQSLGYAQIGVLKWEDLENHSLPQDFGDMIGWQEMAEKAEKAFRSLPEREQSQTTIVCDNYGQAGALDFYGQSTLFRQNLVSDNGSFVLWNKNPLQFRNLLIIDINAPRPELLAKFRYDRFTILDSVQNPLAREYGVKIMLLEGVDSTLVNFINTNMDTKKSQFSRNPN